MLTLTLRRTGQPGVPLPCEEGENVTCPFSVQELDWLELTVSGLTEPQPLCLVAGDTTLAAKPEKVWADGGSYAARFPIGQFFERFAGLGSLRVLQTAHQNRLLCQLDVAVHPSKITLEKLSLLVSELEQLELGLILDIYGKTEVALDGARPVRSLPPEAFLLKATRAVAEFQQALSEIERRPHHGNREVWDVQPYRPGRVLRPGEIGALARAPEAFSAADPSDPEAIQAGGMSLRIDWVPSTQLVPEYDIYEHRAMKGFLRYLARAVNSLARAARAEYDERNSAKARANSWWDDIDAPRLPVLLDREAQSLALARHCTALERAYTFVGKAGRFHPPLRSTAVFSRLSPYRRAYTAMSTVWKETGGAEVRFPLPDADRAKIQDISRLYEYWGTLAVLQVMREHFDLVIGDATQSFVDTRRFVTTLRSGADAWFRTADQRLIRVRYEPFYRAKNDGAGAVGRLGIGLPLRPDMTLEICQNVTDQVPQTMIVLDFKYRRDGEAPLEEDIDKIKHYMQDIVDLRRFPKRLPRHGWIVYPSGAQAPYTDYDIFDPEIPVGQVETRGGIPAEPGTGNAVLRGVLLRLLQLEGLSPTRTGS